MNKRFETLEGKPVNFKRRIDAINQPRTSHLPRDDAPSLPVSSINEPADANPSSSDSDIPCAQSSFRFVSDDSDDISNLIFPDSSSDEDIPCAQSRFSKTEHEWLLENNLANLKRNHFSSSSDNISSPSKGRYKCILMINLSIQLKY